MKGRVTRTINTDGTDTLADYQGCGCAGGEIVTLYGEQLEEGRRTQRKYSDLFGRNVKTEMLDWTGQVYKAATNTYNGRDQVISSKVFAGTEYATEFRETTQTYDGHGRMASKHEPEQNAHTATVYTYFPDDVPQTITDARGAAKHFTYNNLGLIDQINWTVPNQSGIEVPTTVNFQYDNTGNRTQMTDGFGTVEYVYNALSQITSETRRFNETVPLSPENNDTFGIQYTYSQGGQLSTLTEPFGEVVSYGYDKIGRLKSVSGNRASENVQLDYVTDTKYRAWGAVKRFEYGSIHNKRIEYNDRLQASEYQDVWAKLQYTYHADGRLSFSDIDSNAYGTMNYNMLNFDRKYKYDFLGRLTEARTGAEARSGQNQNDPLNRPYRFMNQYNKFGETTNQSRLHWTAAFGQGSSYENGRMTSETETINVPDWAGTNVNISETIQRTFDADGRSQGKQYALRPKIRCGWAYSFLPFKDI